MYIMKANRHFKILSILILLTVIISISSESASSQKIFLNPEYEKAIDLKPALFGTATYANLAGKNLNDPLLNEIMHALKPPVLRIPGGNAMNFWDWNDGLPVKYDSAIQFIKNKQCQSQQFKSKVKGYHNKRSRILSQQEGPLKGENWAQLAKKGGSKVIWGINVSTSTPEQTLQFMKYLKRKNIVLEMAELGNELYFDKYSCEIPSAKYYIAIAKEHALSVKSIFPNAKIAVPVFSNNARVNPDPESTGLVSARNWNEVIASDQSFYDAVTIHIYFRPFDKKELGFEHDPVKDSVIAWGAVRSAQPMMKSIINWVEKYWGGKEIWMTEWALNNSQKFVPDSFGRKFLPQHTVFSGLFNANVILNMACFESAITAANFWQIYGDNTFGMISGSGDKRPSYYIFRFLSDPIHTASKIEHINIPNVPSVMGPGKFGKLNGPLLDAYAFYNNKKEITHIAIINKSSSAVNVSLDQYKEGLTGKREYFIPDQGSDFLPDWGDADNPQNDGNWIPPLQVINDTVNLSLVNIPEWSFSVISLII